MNKMKSNQTKNLEQQLKESKRLDRLRVELQADLGKYNDEELKVIYSIIHQRFWGSDLDD